jgi:hypothetical protein
MMTLASMEGGPLGRLEAYRGSPATEIRLSASRSCTAGEKNEVSGAGKPREGGPCHRPAVSVGRSRNGCWRFPWIGLASAP